MPDCRGGDLRLVDAASAATSRPCARSWRNGSTSTRRSPMARRRSTGRPTGIPGNGGSPDSRRRQVERVTDLGVPPLWIACSNGSGEMVGLLLKAGASSKASAAERQKRRSWRALRPAASWRSASLLGAVPMPNAVGATRGQTALDVGRRRKAPDRRRAAHTGEGRRQCAIDRGLHAAAVRRAGRRRRLCPAPVRRRRPHRRGLGRRERTPMLVAAASLEAVSPWTTVSSRRRAATKRSRCCCSTAAPTLAAADSMAERHSTSRSRRGNRPWRGRSWRRGADPNARIAKSLPYRRADYVSRAGHNGATPFWLAAMAADVEFMRCCSRAGPIPRVLRRTRRRLSWLRPASGRPIRGCRPRADARGCQVRSGARRQRQRGQRHWPGQDGPRRGRQASRQMPSSRSSLNAAPRSTSRTSRDERSYHLTQSVLRPRPATAALLQRLEKEAAESHP